MNLDLLDNILLTADTRVSACQSISHREYPVSVVNATMQFLHFTHRNMSHLPQCAEQLRLFRVFHLHNCTARLYQRLDRKGHFVLEPLLCYRDASSVTADFTGGHFYVKVTLSVRDEAAMREVTSELRNAGEEVESVEWMELWDAEISVSPQLTRWRVDPLRLTSDRTEAEMRVHCSDWAACESLR